MPQFQALKDLRHDNKLVHAGSVVPSAWIEEWEGYGTNTVAKMKRNLLIQLVPGDQELEEAKPIDLAVGLSNVALSTAERAAVQQFLGNMSEGEALEYVRAHNLVQDVAAANEVDPATVDVAEVYEEDGDQPEETEEAFDPSEHSVADVKAFVEENPDSAADVMDAEYAGKNRSTLVKWLEEFVEGQPDEPDDDASDDDDGDDDS